MLNYVKFLNIVLISTNGYLSSFKKLAKLLVVSKIVHKKMPFRRKGHS